MIPGTVFRDAGIGAITGELLSAVMTALEKAAEFRTVLQSLQSTLQTIIPTVQEIQGLNEKLARKKDELEPLIKDIEGGVQLVKKCSTIRWYTYWKRPRYRDKLVSLDESLTKFCALILQLQQSRDIKETLIGVNQILGRKPRNVKGYFVPEAISNPVGFGVPLGELKMELFKEGTSLLVLSAPPGCGKTTLAKLLCNDKDVKERFKDNILFIPMSKKETMEGIVQQVYQLKDQGDPTFRSEEDARNQLEQLLRNIGPNPILLVLDDVWPESVSLLEKLKFNIPGYKILATSRLTYRNYTTYKLHPLNKKDSRKLFNNSAFPSGQQPSDIPEDVISPIVKECKGYPLALTIVGKSLCGLSVEEWRTRALELTKAGPVSQRDELSELYSCLQKSLDALDKTPTIKECFMDLALFSKDDLVPAAALIDMWSELYKFDEDGVQAVANLHQLSTRNLADLVVTRTDAEGYNHHYVTQHDLLRELIIYQSNLEAFQQRERLIMEIFRNEVPDWWTDKMQPLAVHCIILSISTDEKFSGSWCKIQAPELKALVLNFRTKSYPLPDFLTGSNGMKVLMLMNYGISPAELTNFRVLGSLPNLKKIRLDRVSIAAFLFTSLQFNSLEKITLVLCHLGQAFAPSTLLISVALPNVKEINIDYCKDLVELPLGICKLTKLKKLRITNCHNLVAIRPEIWRLKNLEELTLSSCIGLAELPETIGSLENLRTLDISECADVRTLPEEIGELRNLRKIQMMGCSRNCHLPDSIQNLDCLEEVGCDEETAVLWEPFGHVLKNLKIKVHKEDINLNWLHGGQF